MIRHLKKRPSTILTDQLHRVTVGDSVSVTDDINDFNLNPLSDADNMMDMLYELEVAYGTTIARLNIVL